MARKPRTRPAIALLTDFGYRDHYAGVMRGVIASIAPDARVIDLTHGIPPQAVVAGAIALRESRRYFPPGTIFLAVVDPGVGTNRLPIAIETYDGARFVGPDNGVLSLAADDAGIRTAVKLTAAKFRLKQVSATFHGRDIFAPAAAWLACGTPIRAMGPTVKQICRIELPAPKRSGREIRGQVIYVDSFGNLVTNIRRNEVANLIDCFREKVVSVRIERRAPMKILEAYGDAPVGDTLATFGSFEMLEIAVRDGNAASRFRSGPGARVIVSMNR